jgi:hypothetical protein
MTTPVPPAAEPAPMPASSVRFAGAARVLGDAVRRRGLQAPAYRSPPRVANADRTVRRRADGSVAIAVRVRGRPWSAVLADMIEGVVVTNRLEGPDADAARTALWAAVEADAPASASPRPAARRARRRPTGPLGPAPAAGHALPVAGAAA